MAAVSSARYSATSTTPTAARPGDRNRTPDVRLTGRDLRPLGVSWPGSAPTINLRIAAAAGPASTPNPAGKDSIAMPRRNHTPKRRRPTLLRWCADCGAIDVYQLDDQSALDWRCKDCRPARKPPSKHAGYALETLTSTDTPLGDTPQSLSPRRDA
jgi:hypothetical protein